MPRSSRRPRRGGATSTRDTRLKARTPSTSFIGPGAGTPAGAGGGGGGCGRSRGGLQECNQFRRGGASDAFTTVVGDRDAIRLVRYVITLDADTMLPPAAGAGAGGGRAPPPP